MEDNEWNVLDKIKDIFSSVTKRLVKYSIGFGIVFFIIVFIAGAAMILEIINVDNSNSGTGKETKFSRINAKEVHPLAQEIFTIADNDDNKKQTGDPNKDNYREYSPQNYFESIVISKNGRLYEGLEVKEMWKNDDRYRKYLANEDELRYFLNTQIVTKYPNILNPLIEGEYLLDNDTISSEQYDKAVNGFLPDNLKQNALSGDIKNAILNAQSSYGINGFFILAAYALEPEISNSGISNFADKISSYITKGKTTIQELGEKYSPNTQNDEIKAKIWSYGIDIYMQGFYKANKLDISKIKKPSDEANEFILNGHVEFYRNDSIIRMYYVPQGEFEKYIKSFEQGNQIAGIVASNSFTVNDDWSIRIAYLQENTHTVVTNDSHARNEAVGKLEGAKVTSENGTYSVGKNENYMYTKKISYSRYVNKYSLPFNLLWEISVSAGMEYKGNKLARAIADIAYSGEISLIIDDNNSKMTSVDTYNYDSAIFYNGTINAEQDGIKKDSININDFTVKKGSYRTTYTKTTNSNSPSLKIKKIESWCAIFENDAEFKSSDFSSNNKNTNTLDKDERENSGTISFEDAIKVPINDLATWKTRMDEQYEDIAYTGSINVSNGYSKIVLENETRRVSKRYANGTVTSPKFNSEIVGILQSKKFYEASGVVCDLSDNSKFYKMMELNPDTAELVDLMKFIAFNAVNKLPEEDFETIWKRYFGKMYNYPPGSIPIAIDGDFYMSKEDFVEGIRTYNGMSGEESRGFQVFRDNAEFIYDECLKEGINPILCIIQAINESGWGTSWLAVNKNNFFGLGASDDGAGANANGWTFTDLKDCLTKTGTKQFGWLQHIKRFTAGGAKYPIMEQYVEWYQPIRPEITINSLYAMTAVYAPIYPNFTHATSFLGGTYRSTVIQKNLIDKGYIQGCNHSLSDPISVEEGAAYAVEYGDRLKKSAEQIWGEAAVAPDSGTGNYDSSNAQIATTISGSKSVSNAGLANETYYILSDPDAAQRVANPQLNNPNWWYFDTYKNSRGLTYTRYYSMDTRITGESPINKGSHSSCGIGALSIAMSPYLSEKVSPYNIQARRGGWIPVGGWSLG